MIANKGDRHGLRQNLSCSRWFSAWESSWNFPPRGIAYPESDEAADRRADSPDAGIDLDPIQPGYIVFGDYRLIKYSVSLAKVPPCEWLARWVDHAGGRPGPGFPRQKSTTGDRSLRIPQAAIRLARETTRKAQLIGAVDRLHRCATDSWATRFLHLFQIISCPISSAITPCFL